MEHPVFVRGHAHVCIKYPIPFPRGLFLFSCGGRQWLGKIQSLPDDIRLCNSISRPSNAVKGARGWSRWKKISTSTRNDSGWKRGGGICDKTRSKSGNLILPSPWMFRRFVPGGRGKGYSEVYAIFAPSGKNSSFLTRPTTTRNKSRGDGRGKNLETRTETDNNKQTKREREKENINK